MLPKKERLTKGREIKQTIKGKDVSFKTPLFLLAAKESHGGITRMAVITRKTLGGAVKRNKARRRIVAAFSNIRHKIEKKYDIVLLILGIGKNSEDYQRELLKASIFNDSHNQIFA